MTGTDRTMASIVKNGRETLTVRLTEFKGARLVDLRVFVPGADGAPVATGKGVALTVEKLAELRAALDRAEHAARAAGWLS